MLKDNLAVVLGMFETGLAVGRSLGRAGVRVLGVDWSKKLGFHSKYIDPAICPHPLAHEEEFITFLLRLAAREKERRVLFITSDEFLLPVSRNRKRLEQHYLMNLPESHIIECITDKYRQYKLALESGIPVPQTFVANNMRELKDIQDVVPLPAFVKGAEVTLWREKIGVNRKGFVVSTKDELINTFKTIFGLGVNGLVQEIIPGPDTNYFAACCYISQKGEFLLSFGLQKLRQSPVGFGFGCLVESVEYPEMLDLGKAFLQRISYRGVAFVEFKLDQRDRKLKLIELNPRYWQQNGLAERCGMNFPLINYLELTGSGSTALHDYDRGIKWVNIYHDFESFREHRLRGELSLMKWVRSLKGPKMLSDFAFDDLLPGLHEFVSHLIGRIRNRVLKAVALSGFTPVASKSK